MQARIQSFRPPLGLSLLMVGLAVLPWLLPNSFYLDLVIRMAINAIIVLGLNVSCFEEVDG